MTEKLIKISCDWCGDWQESSLKGTGEKTLRKKAQRDWDWKSVLLGNSEIRDFCCIECYEHWKSEESFFSLKMCCQNQS